MIGRDHPAVEAASKAWGESAPTGAATWAEMSDRLQGITRARMAAALSAALPDLDAATPENLARLRDTPVGRALMAEAWDEGARFAQGGRVYNNSNPYLEADQ